MTSSIKGPGSPGSPPPPGQPSSSGPSGRVDKGMDLLLSRRDGNGQGITARQGSGSDTPLGGTRMGQRHDHIRTIAADRGTRLSEAWADFTRGTGTFSDLLAKVLPSRPDATGRDTGLAAQLRKDLSVADLLPPSLTNASARLDDPSPRSMGSADAGRLAEQLGSLLDALLGAKGDVSPLTARFSQSSLSGLREQSERLLATLPPQEATGAIRSLARETIFDRAILPELLSIAAQPKASGTLGSAALSLHALLTGSGHLSPDLATALAPLGQDLATRFDDLLRALRLPGFTG